MADELKYSIELRVSKGGRIYDTRDMALNALLVTMSGTDIVQGTQSIGFASSEAIGKGEITTPGFMVVKNMDATNFVEIERTSFTSGNGTIKLKAGEAALFRFSATAPHALADTAAVEIAYLLVEN